jgi:hypothetical protein
MSSTEFSTVRCGCCDETGHSTRRCPQLRPPPHGFDKGGTRIPDDEEEDCSTVKQKAKAINIYITPLKNPRAKKRSRPM